jgi:hypothetical protein
MADDLDSSDLVFALGCQLPGSNVQCCTALLCIAAGCGDPQQLNGTSSGKQGHPSKTLAKAVSYLICGPISAVERRNPMIATENHSVVTLVALVPDSSLYQLRLLVYAFARPPPALSTRHTVACP